MDTINKLVELDFCKVVFYKAGFVELIFADDVLINEINSEQMTTTLADYLGDKKVPILQVLGKYMNFTKEAREFSVTEKGIKNVLVNAFVLDSLPHKILANFYLKMDKPPVPTKLFSTRDEALGWINEYL